MISGMETGKNVIAENEGYRKNKSDIGIWTEQLENHPKKSTIQGYRELGRILRKSLKNIMQKGMMRNDSSAYQVAKITMYLVRNSTF